ncbi:C-type lectin domain family 1 member A-like [Candoia aspera]|uniref:C-type lectin domain family 1 member A-like n=1 Tax=Candoia aspera TaxID=51853 RepID=UPI002FD7F105
MSLKVGLLEKKINEEADVWQWKILTLTEILRDLQIGKVPTCSICKVQWVQQGDNCFLFRDKRMGWHSSQGFCQHENAYLAVVRNTIEMKFLKFHSNKHYHLDPEIYKYDKFWIGLSYDTTKGRWLWVDGTPFDSRLYEKLDHKGCAYLQNGTLYSQNCSETAKIICATNVQFGWS